MPKQPYKDFWGVKNINTGTVAGVTQEQFHTCLAKRGPDGAPLFEDFTMKLAEHNQDAARANLIETAKSEQEAAEKRGEEEPEVVRVKAAPAAKKTRKRTSRKKATA